MNLIEVYPEDGNKVPSINLICFVKDIQGKNSSYSYPTCIYCNKLLVTIWNLIPGSMLIPYIFLPSLVDDWNITSPGAIHVYFSVVYILVLISCTPWTLLCMMSYQANLYPRTLSFPLNNIYVCLYANSMCFMWHLFTIFLIILSYK
jgi:hypothetical protein